MRLLRYVIHLKFASTSGTAKRYGCFPPVTDKHSGFSSSIFSAFIANGLGHGFGLRFRSCRVQGSNECCELSRRIHLSLATTSGTAKRYGCFPPVTDKHSGFSSSISSTLSSLTALATDLVFVFVLVEFKCPTSAARSLEEKLECAQVPVEGEGGRFLLELQRPLAVRSNRSGSMPAACPWA